MSRKELALKLLLQNREACLTALIHTDITKNLPVDPYSIEDAYDEAGEILNRLAKLETTP